MTAKKRKETYERALKFMKRGYGYVHWLYMPSDKKEFHSACLCGAMCSVLGSRFDIDDFPELLECKPARKREDEFWWPITEEGFMIRIMALDYAIQHANNNARLEESISQLG